MSKRDVAYGRTALGQAVYDFGFTTLTDKHLARKHRMPIGEVRRVRADVRAALQPPRRPTKRGRK